MIYSNPEFFILAIVSLALYWFARRSYNARHWILLVASIIFYAWAGIFDTVIFVFVVAISWLAVWAADRHERYRKFFIVTGITVMAAHLFFWKYGPWITGLIQKIFPRFYDGKALEIPLPVGISFFTLQGIAYLVDYYKRESKLMPLKRYLLFKSFFPQLVAGPIVRAKQLAPYLETLPFPSKTQVADGLTLFTIGFAKKVALADRLAPLIDPVFANPAHFDRTALVAAVLGYTVQIWGDFSGYTDMGRGVAKLFGIDLPENFLSPYLATSPSDFWRRWHITLSQWIRDYIYIPLGGSRGSKARVVFIAILTMMISGLWHGAGVTFILWGLYHGFLLAVERGLKESSISATFTSNLTPRFLSTLSTATMLAATVFGWLIFRCQSSTLLKAYVQSLISPLGTASIEKSDNIVVACILCAGVQAYTYLPLGSGSLEWLQFPRTKVASLARRVFRSELSSEVALGILLSALWLTALFFRPAKMSSQFIYFQF